MVKDAEKFSEEDKKQKEEVETRNQADSMIYQAEKTIKDFKEKADKSQIDNLQNAVDALKEAVGGNDIDDIKNKTEELTKPLYELTTAMYQQAQAEGQSTQSDGAGAGPEAAPGGEDENVVDADYEVKDDSEQKE